MLSLCMTKYLFSLTHFPKSELEEKVENLERGKFDLANRVKFYRNVTESFDCTKEWPNVPQCARIYKMYQKQNNCTALQRWFSSEVVRLIARWNVNQDVSR